MLMNSQSHTQYNYIILSIIPPKDIQYCLHLISMEKQIKISVLQPQIYTDASLPYVSYLVSGQDSKGKFQCRRRYRDFHLLRQKIAQRWPGLYVPPISSKKVAGNTEDKFVELRRRFLNYFCQKIAERPYFFYSDVFQLFARGQGQFQKSIKQLQKISIDYETLSIVYQKNFTELTKNSTSAQLQFNCENDYDFMKQSQKKLERIREDLRNLSNAKQQYQKQFNVCMGSSLPEYQDKFLIKYVQDDKSKLFLNNGDQFNRKLKQYQEYTSDNALQDYCQLISYELRQMRAFTEAIQSRKKAEQTKLSMQKQRRAAKQEVQKLKLGKTTLKSIFSSGSKQDQTKKIQQQIAKSQRDEEGLGNMIFLMNAAICHELQEYKKRRKTEYRSDIEKINKKQIKQMNILGELLQMPLRDEKHQIQDTN